MESELKILSELVAQITGQSGLVETGIPGLACYCRTKPNKPENAMYEPVLCLTVQGAKRVVLGGDTYTYDSSHFLLSSIDIPTTVQVVKASQQKPCLGLVIKLDLKEISQLVVESDLPQPKVEPASRGIALGEVTLPLLDAFKRLLNLLNEPENIPILAPLIKREIFFRILVGDQGARLRQMASAGSSSHQIAKAINWLKDNYTNPLRVEELASHVHMSPSTFHHHFRKMTAMSPLQYQKWLRLNEARRLMLSDSMDAGLAAFRVGYESQSQFSREYSRLFGNSPLRDIKNIRQGDMLS